MRRSYNEVFATTKRAAVGAGLDYGLAEDIAAAAHWLCEHGFDGTGLALAAIKNAAGQAQCEYASGTFKDARAAVAGPSAIDMSCMGTDVELLNLDVPLLLFGLAGVAAGAGYRITLTGPGDVQIGIAATGINGNVEGFSTGLDVAVTAKRISFDTEPASDGSGTDIDPATWKQIETLAFKTYVPASEASRAKGAGAGLTDND